MMNEAANIKIIARNRKARHDYQIRDTIEVGIELLGTEVKSVREGKINIADAYAFVEKGQVFLKNLHISPYHMDTGPGHDPLRIRRLLLHKREIRKINSALSEKRLSLVPTKIYFNNRGLVKLEVALGKGKKMFDKRETIKKRTIDKAIGRTLKVRIR